MSLKEYVQEIKSNSNKIIYDLAILVVTGGIIGGVFFYNNYFKKNRVEDKLITPSRLEFKCNDFDGDGLKDTCLGIKNKNGKYDYYLLKEVEGKPVLTPYEINLDKYVKD